MDIKLKDFVNSYDILYEKDADMILAWAAHCHKELELIQLIAPLAAYMHNDFRTKERKTWEWVYYATQNIMPEITKDMDGTKIINMIRMYHMAYEDDAVFAEKAKEFEKVDKFEWSLVETLHPEIVQRYRNGCAVLDARG